MDVRQYVALMRRQWPLVVATILVVFGSTLTIFALRPDEYRATAIVLLRPPDPTERFRDPGAQSTPEVNVLAEAAFVGSLVVAREAAEALPGADPAELRRRVAVTPDATTGLVSIHFTDRSPARARDVATAVAKAFVANRIQAAADRRQRLTIQFDTKLQELRKRIDELTAGIGDSGLPSGPLNALVDGGPPGSPRAQRFAAALQYQQIFERQQQLMIEQGLDQSGAELVTEAGLPRVPVGPGLLQASIVAAFVGGLIGFALALLREYLLDRVQSRDEVEDAGHTVLAELPRDRSVRPGLHQLVCLNRPLSPIAEGIRTLRTRLQTIESERPLRSFVVTSAHRGEGKSFVAVNLATSFAQAGYSTVLVADLRRPAFDSVFAVSEGERTLAGLLAAGAPTDRPPPPVPPLPRSARSATVRWPPPPGGSSIQPSGMVPSVAAQVRDALLPTQVLNLRYLAGGSVSSNPDQVGSSGMAAILDVLTAMVDIVIFDSPPALEAADGVMLANLVDGVVFVTAQGDTRRGALASATGNLVAPGGRVRGIVLNKVARGHSPRRASDVVVGAELREQTTDGPVRLAKSPTRPTDADKAPVP